MKIELQVRFENKHPDETEASLWLVGTADTLGTLNSPRRSRKVAEKRLWAASTPGTGARVQRELELQAFEAATLYFLPPSLSPF